MTDTRQALEEAWDKIHPMPELSDIVSRDEFLMAMEVSWPARSRFRRFLDAEAWTDAALMLVPEGWGWNVSQPNAKAIASGLLKEETPVRGEVENGFEQRFIVAGETPALAIAQAAIRAKEAGDVHQTPA